MAFYGSPFDAEIKNGRIEGKGKYTFPDGNVYEGNFKDGQFHGKGTIFFRTGGVYEALWDYGLVVDGQFTFKDGLKYEPDSWTYCTEKDRRFHTEKVNGIGPAGRTQLTNDPTPKKIPNGAFDCGDGYYQAKDNIIYDYQGKELRIPDEEEALWIVQHCRVGDDRLDFC